MEIQSGFSVRDSRLSFLCHVTLPPCPATLFLPRDQGDVCEAARCGSPHRKSYRINFRKILLSNRMAIAFSFIFVVSFTVSSRYLPSFFLFTWGLLFFHLGFLIIFQKNIFIWSFLKPEWIFEGFQFFFFLYLSIEIFVGIFKALPIFPGFRYSLRFFSKWFASYFLYHIFRNFFRD